MTKDDILELAREAGFEQLGPDIEDWVCFTDEIERFAELLEAKIRADEREACAKECEAEAQGRSPSLFDALCDCADAIRARGEK